MWGHNNKLYQEAKDYQDFDNQVRTDNGLNPQNTTKNELIYTKVNQDTNLYTVGPFNVTYTEGIYGGICFGGIHDMKIIGYNSEGNIVRDDITIEKFIIERYQKQIEPEMKNIKLLKQILDDYLKDKDTTIKIVMLKEFSKDLGYILNKYKLSFLPKKEENQEIKDELNTI